MNQSIPGAVATKPSAKGGVQDSGSGSGFRVVELFCGAGGMSLGLRQAGMEIVGAGDKWADAVAAYNDNVGDHARVVDMERPHDVVPWLIALRPDMIAGGAPCQDFSPAGKRVEGERAGLTVALATVCASVRPRYVLFENVQRAAKSSAWQTAKSVLCNAGYGLTEIVLNASFYGVPQNRKRAFLIGRLGERDGFLDADLRDAASERPTTLRDVFGDSLGSHIYHHPRHANRRGVFSVDGPAPTVRDARRPQPAGYKSHPLDSNALQATTMHLRGHAGARSVFSLDEPASAVIRTSRGRPREECVDGPHPNDAGPAEAAYVPTQMDMARIQGFPASYDWSPVRLSRDVDQMIANAVPPGLACAIAIAILRRDRGETAPRIEGNFGQWLLRSGRVANRQMASNVKWRVAKARQFVQGRTFADPLQEIAALEAVAEFRARSTRDRSSFRAALRLYREWQDLPPRQKAKRKGANRKVQAKNEASPPRIVIASPPPLEPEESRVLAWVSGGAASIVAARLAIEEFGLDRVRLVRCETGNEDEDNLRFELDAQRWLGKKVTLLRSDEYDDVMDVWRRRKFMAGVRGAPCTTHMKVAPRLAYQRPTDIHVFGYTADPSDIRRFHRLRETYFELTVRAPLVERRIDKSEAMKTVLEAGLTLPRTYGMGFPNANCLQTGCAKASGAGYWNLFKRNFPERFERTARFSRSIGARLVKIGGKRMFLDELPPDAGGENDPPPCDFLCAGAEMLASPRP